VTDSVRVGIIGLARQDAAAQFERRGAAPVLTSDVEAASMLQAGELAYIVGVCESGGGAALAIPMAVAGSARCANLSRLGKAARPEDLPALLESGKVCFGIARDHVADLLPALADAIVARASARPAG
jgi:hypothetical protein